MAMKIMGNALMISVCEAYGVDPRNVRRVIIDAEANEVVRVYFDTIGTEDLTELLPPLAQAPDAKAYIRGANGEPVEVTAAAENG